MTPPPKARPLQWVVTGLTAAAPVVRRADKLKALAARRPVKQLRPGRGRDGHLAQLAPSRLDLLPPPNVMDAAALGRAATLAAREAATAPAPALWAALAQRARELLPTLDPRDLSSLLSGMARVGYDDADGLAAELCECVVHRVDYFGSLQFAMAFAALARLGQLPQGSAARDRLLGELSGRVGELRSAAELTLVLGALARLDARYDAKLLTELAAQVNARLSAGRFHVRDLAAVSAAYVRLAHLEPARLESLAACALFSIREATPRELGRLVLAAALSVTSDGDTSTASRTELVGSCVPLVSEKIRFMLSLELAEIVSAFGQASEAGLCDPRASATLLEAVTEHATKLPPNPELLGLLRSITRARTDIALGDVSRIAIAAAGGSNGIVPGHAAEALFFVAQAVSRNPVTTVSLAAAVPEAAEDIAVALRTISTLGQTVLRSIEEGDAVFDSEMAVVRAVEAACVLEVGAEEHINAAGNTVPSTARALTARFLREPAFSVAQAELLRRRLVTVGCDTNNPVILAIDAFCSRCTTVRGSLSAPLQTDVSSAHVVMST